MINNVTLVGRLTKDPDLRYTSSGSGVATFTLAVNRSFTNQNGDREADFINCVIWRKPAETMANYARKGTLLGVVGRIQTRNYENQQGQRVYVTEVVCESFQLLESKKSKNSGDSVQDHAHGFSNSISSKSKTEPNNDLYGKNSMFKEDNNSNIPNIHSDDLPF
ncbi:single-stranded DNA-binding protein [Enterococcus faecalis]|nr:single-stranded DNA-binding protein [Enterococcus faecalis]